MPAMGQFGGGMPGVMGGMPGMGMPQQNMFMTNMMPGMGMSMPGGGMGGFSTNTMGMPGMGMGMGMGGGFGTNINPSQNMSAPQTKPFNPPNTIPQSGPGPSFESFQRDGFKILGREPIKTKNEETSKEFAELFNLADTKIKDRAHEKP